MMTTRERFQTIERRIGAACERAGRDRAQVRLIGASKSQGVARIRAAYDAGLRRFGENRVQEAASKQPSLPGDIEWHLFGPLQSNKIRSAVRSFSVLHAIDRVKIALLVEREASLQGKRLGGFLEVNLGAEESKHGFRADRLAAEVGELAALEHLLIVGLMSIPPQTEDPEAARLWFRRLRELRDELLESEEWQSFPGYLSMGMSGDFEIAIEEGATHVRVGTALFGPRPAPSE
jgi:pyridoxal phosphate enzyme (YggS family)